MFVFLLFLFFVTKLSKDVFAGVTVLYSFLPYLPRLTENKRLERKAMKGVLRLPNKDKDDNANKTCSETKAMYSRDSKEDKRQNERKGIQDKPSVKPVSRINTDYGEEDERHSRIFVGEYVKQELESLYGIPSLMYFIPLYFVHGLVLLVILPSLMYLLYLFMIFLEMIFFCFLGHLSRSRLRPCFASFIVSASDEITVIMSFIQSWRF